MRMRGARPSPRHTLAAAHPHRVAGATPSQWIYKPSKLSMFGNDQFGDCVTAEEAFAKACHVPEILISDNEVETWANANGFLDGADLVSVMSVMQKAGFSQNGFLYNDGPYSSVDWTNPTILRNAIVQGPVKIAVAADQLQIAVPDPPVNGWFARGFKSDNNIDHCVSLCGFGTVSWLARQLGGGVPAVYEGIPGYALFTWDSIGIIDVPSMLAITAEAWLRYPVTVTLADGGVNQAALKSLLPNPVCPKGH